MKVWEKHLEALNKNYNKVNCDNRIKIPKEEIRRLRELGWTEIKLGIKYGVTKQRISQIVGFKRHSKLKIIKTLYCKRCESKFNSKLPLGEAICINCGSEKIVKI